VVFDETIFPFAQLHPNAGARLRSEISLLSPDLVPSTSDQGEEQLDDHMFNLPNASNGFVEDYSTGNRTFGAATGLPHVPEVINPGTSLPRSSRHLYLSRQGNQPQRHQPMMEQPTMDQPMMLW
jgi:hypothetical protein